MRMNREAQLNPSSEIVYAKARCDSSVLSDHFNLQVRSVCVT